MIYDHAFVPAIARARVDRLVAEAEAARTARALRTSRPRRRWFARGWLRSRRRTAVAAPSVPLGPFGLPPPCRQSTLDSCTALSAAPLRAGDASPAIGCRRELGSDAPAASPTNIVTR